MNKIPSACVLIVCLVAVAAGCSGCKRRTTVEIPKAILHARNATLDQLLHIVNRYEGIRTLQCGIKAEYTSREMENDQIELEKYPKAPGHILLQRPDSTYLVIQNPVLKTREISLLSEGDEFRAFIHRKNTLFIGSNSATELVSEDQTENPKIPIRATHVFQAILPESVSIQNTDIRISKMEMQDAQSTYYVLNVYRENGPILLRPFQEFQIERVGLTVSRQRIFDEDGRIVADIAYSDVAEHGEFLLPGKIHIERPLDGYTLDLELADWRVNPVFKEDIFKLEPPPGVQVTRFK